MRKIFSKIHLWLSIPAGIIISVICLTGASLVFEQEITRMLNRNLWKVEPSGEQMMPSELVMSVRGYLGDSSANITSIAISGKADEPVQISVEGAGRRSLVVNQYTGEVLGWTKSYGFFRTMKKAHRYFLDAPKSKGEMSVGKFIVGAATLFMVVILISGLVIWVPKSAKALKHRLTVKVGKGWKRFLYDSHVSLGFYATIFLLVMALTGLTWSFKWYRNFAYSLFSEKGTVKMQEEKAEPQPFSIYSWDNALGTLNEIYPEYVKITLSQGSASVQPERFLKVRMNDAVSMDASTGEITDVRLYKDMPRSQVLKGWFYSFHTGSWGGLLTKILYFIAALAGGFLPLTGYWLWLKRKKI